MRIRSGHEIFLVLQSSETGSRTVKVVPSQDKAIADWNATTRISPVFEVDGFSGGTIEFRGEEFLLFLGPIHPEHILSRCCSESRVWISLGLYNLIILPPTKNALDELIQIAQEKSVPYEFWELQSGVIRDVNFWKPLTIAADEWKKQLCDLSQSSFPVELREAIREYCSLVASTLSRSIHLPSYVQPESIKIGDALTDLFKSFSEKSLIEVTYRNLSEVLKVNAGLSRYSSQTFAGTTPIFERECHFWSNSLLGIGVATIALRNIRSFLDKTLAKSRIPERFEKFKKITQDIPNLPDGFPLGRDYLGDVKLDDTSNPLIPLITYFSARDGYGSTQTTISAPTASISSCNCPRWSLMTLTHEFSHVIMRAILADIYPDLSNDSEVTECKKLLDIPSQQTCDTLFDEIRRICLYSAIKMENPYPPHQKKDTDTPSDPKTQYDIDAIKGMLIRQRHDTEETIVHVFDFLYFYGRDIDKYVSGIWASWGVIPNVSTRVYEYVVRTICAVLSCHFLKGAAAENIAKEDVKKAMLKLKESKLGGRYISEALDLIENQWKDELFYLVQARRLLVKTVSTFIFSNKIATELRTELKVSGGAGRKEGYTLKPGILELDTITNPIMFIEAYANDRTPSPPNSVWLFYVLAFCLENIEHQ